MDWRQTGKDRFRIGVMPVGKWISGMGVTANQVTVAGVLLSLVSGICFFRCNWRLGTLFLIAGASCDFLDGAVARAEGSVGKAGAFLDSVLDRYAEMFVYVGLLGCFVNRGMLWAGIGIMLALAGSLLVSYARARAEGLGFQCSGGIAQRPERLILLILGVLLGERILVIMVWVIAILSHGTALHRFRSVLQAARRSEKEDNGSR